MMRDIDITIFWKYQKKMEDRLTALPDAPWTMDGRIYTAESTIWSPTSAMTSLNWSGIPLWIGTGSCAKEHSDELYEVEINASILTGISRKCWDHMIAKTHSGHHSKVEQLGRNWCTNSRWAIHGAQALPKNCCYDHTTSLASLALNHLIDKHQRKLQVNRGQQTLTVSSSFVNPLYAVPIWGSNRPGMLDVYAL